MKNIEFIEDFDTNEVNEVWIEYDKKIDVNEVLKDIKQETSRYVASSKKHEFKPAVVVIYPYCRGWETGYKARVFSKEEAKKQTERINYGFTDEIEGKRNVTPLF